MNEPKRQISFHPLLFAIAPVAALYAHNQAKIPLSALATPMLICIAFAALAWAALGYLLRSRVKGAVLASVLCLLLLAFGHVVTMAHWYLADWGGFRRIERQGLEWALLAILVLVILGVGLALWRTKRSLATLNYFLNVTASIVVAFSILNISRAAIAGRSAPWIASKPSRVIEPMTRQLPPIEHKPDVYIIMADAHARWDVLRDLYDYDAEPFLAELEGRGFRVCRDSRANYSVTLLAAPAMLDFNYIRELDGRTETGWHDMEERFRGARLPRLLKAHGYTIVGFETGYDFTRLTNADRVYRPSTMSGSEFHYAFLKMTPLPLLLGGVSMFSEGAWKRQDTLFLLDTVPVVADDPDPTFAWVHLTIPHAPFVFGPDGQDVERRYRDTEDFGANERTASQQADYVEAYRGQVAYAEKRILQLIDEIFARSSEPPIILLLSDHGPRLNTFRDENWRSSDLREALANLTAAHFPSPGSTEALHDSITPVNVVRVMLNEHFRMDLPLVEDRSFHSPYGISPFWLFWDVTDELGE